MNDPDPSTRPPDVVAPRKTKGAKKPPVKLGETGTQAKYLKSTVEEKPAEHPKDRISRITLAQEEHRLKSYKDKKMFQFSLFALGTLILVSSFLMFSEKTHHQSFAIASLSSCVSGFLAYLSGRNQAKD